MYDVLINCKAGTKRLTNGYWEDNYHVICWTSEENKEKARSTLVSLEAYKNPNIKRAWVEERD